MHWHYWLGFSLFLAPSMCLCVCRRHVVFFFCGGCIVSLTLTGLRSNDFENFDKCHQRLPSTQWWTEKGWTLNFRWTVPFQYVAIGAHIAIRFPPAKRKKKSSSCVFSIQWQLDRLHVEKPGRGSGSGGNSHCVGLSSGGKAERKQKTAGKQKEFFLESYFQSQEVKSPQDTGHRKTWIFFPRKVLWEKCCQL